MDDGRRADGAPLRAVINLGNAVLAHGDPESPRGVSVDLARELGRRSGRAVELRAVTAARDAVEALETGAADLGFLAHDPDRSRTLAFTDPYVMIEGCFAVPEAAPPTVAEEADRPGLRIGAKRGSALHLHLARTVEGAELVPLPEHPLPGEDPTLDVITGIRDPLTAALREAPGWRLLEPAFLRIPQCVAVPAAAPAADLGALSGAVRELLVSGFVARSLAADGRSPDLAAAPS
ncbi:transporter substrate-binding domain-containing protein [Brachybacterium rhamnosum]|uniref:Transporter substrate-binding domain-containing protein n=1 Tax=Brachybacterium rhamnosum TaxID=173361 RepID=A0ABW4PY16_9MICO